MVEIKYFKKKIKGDRRHQTLLGSKFLVSFGLVVGPNRIFSLKMVGFNQYNLETRSIISVEFRFD